MDPLIRYSSRVGGTGRPDSVVGVANRFHATACKTVSGNSCKTILERSNGRINSYGPFDQVLLSGRWYGPTGHRRRRGKPIPCNSMSNSLRKLVKTILERSNGRIYSYGPFDPVL